MPSVTLEGKKKEVVVEENQTKKEKKRSCPILEERRLRISSHVEKKKKSAPNFQSRGKKKKRASTTKRGKEREQRKKKLPSLKGKLSRSLYQAARRERRSPSSGRGITTFGEYGLISSTKNKDGRPTALRWNPRQMLGEEKCLSSKGKDQATLKKKRRTTLSKNKSLGLGKKEGSGGSS